MRVRGRMHDDCAERSDLLFVPLRACPSTKPYGMQHIDPVTSVIRENPSHAHMCMLLLTPLCKTRRPPSNPSSTCCVLWRPDWRRSW